MHLGEISDYEIDNARKVMADHTVRPLTREGALENLFFCIASQGSNWERPTKFVYNLRRKSYPGDNTAVHRFASWDVLTLRTLVNLAAEESSLRYAYSRRFDPSIDHFAHLPGNWWEEVRDADVDSREKFVKSLKWVSYKTFSFWNLCLGGKDLIALDVHIRRQLKNEFGLDMHERYASPTKRGDGQTVSSDPQKAEYLRIEEAAKAHFSRDPRFLQPNGRPDCALIDGLLWWRGANRSGLGQGCFFGSGIETWVLPYSETMLSAPAIKNEESKKEGEKPIRT